MKQAYFLSLMAIAFTFASCKKEEQISPFTETSYTTLAKFDKNGLPNNLLPKDPISPNMEFSQIRNYLQMMQLPILKLRSLQLYT